MSIDLPHVEYAKDKKYSKKDMDECIAANAEIEKRFIEKMRQKGIDESKMEQISLSDLMNTSNNEQQ